MANNIGIRLSVDGEQKFKTAMKQAANSVKDVDTRLKLATAEFKKNGDAQKLMQTRAKTLNEEIKRQTDIVDSLEDALQTVEKQYGENSAQALSYEAQLNKARQKLVQMETALDNNAKGLDENGKAFDSAGEKAEKAAISFTDLNHAITNVQNAAKNAASYVINFAKSAWNAMSNTSEYADNLLTLSAQTGLSVEQLQKYAMAAGLVDTEVSAIYTAMARMVNPSGEMAAALEQLGVNTRDIIGTTDFTGAMKNYVKDTDFADTKARNALDIFWDTIDALKRLSDQGKDVDELTKSIFGKSFLEMKPLIDKGKAGWDEAGDALNNVAGEETIKKLGEFNDALQELKAEFQGLQTEVLGELAPGFTEIAKSLTDLLERFGEWAKSEKGQEALSNLSDAIGGILEGIGEEDFEKLVTTATTIIEKLAGTINSITNDPSGIINSVKGALIGYAALPVSKEVLSLLTLLRSLGGSGIASNIGSVFGKLGNLFAPGASAESAAAAATPAVSAGGHKLLASKALGTAAGIEAVALGVAAVESGVKMIDEITQQGTFLGIGQRDEYGSIDIGGLKFGGNRPDTTSFWNALGYSLGLNKGTGEESVADEAAKAAEAIGDINEKYEEFAEQWRYIGVPEEEIKALFDSMVEQTQAAVDTVKETTEELGETVTETVQEQEMSWFDVFSNAGSTAGEALAAGLTSSIPSISGAVSRINWVMAQIQAGPATTTAYGLGSHTGASVTRNNSIYINNLNQSNAADIYDTLRNMNDAQNTMNRGYGYVYTG